MKAGGGSAPLPIAAVVGVGDELLFGQTVDTNGAWLARELSDLGLRVLRRWVVGDVKEEIQDVLSQGLALAEVILLTGGLGPTRDDLTRPAVAEALGVPLEEDLRVLAGLEANFRARGHGELPATTRVMAQVPRGARVLDNPQGSAPGLAMETKGGKLCVLLPGPPREMKGIFREGVAGLLRETFKDSLSPARHRTIHTTGIPESLLAQKMEPLLPLDPGPISVAFLPDRTGVRLRLTTRGRNKKEAEALFDDLERKVNGVLKPYRYSSEKGDLAEAVGKALRYSGVDLAVAESCTGGLIAKRLTDIPGSSEYFLGGVVAYADAVKVRELGVSPKMVEEEGAVSRSVAEEMARGVAQRFGARGGIGVTGVAGPGGGTAEKPVGTVWYAVSLGDEMEVRKGQFPGDRDSVRERAAQAALALLLHMLEETTP